jgi:hypothetical protein
MIVGAVRPTRALHGVVDDRFLIPVRALLGGLRLGVGGDQRSGLVEP